MAHPLDRGIPTQERASELTAAITAAGSGATIQLQTGRYTGSFAITGKTNLTIMPRPGAYVVVNNRDTRFLVPNALWSTTATPHVYSIGEVIGVTMWLGALKICVAKDQTHFDQMVAAGVRCAVRLASSTLIYLEGMDPRITPLNISNGDTPVFACSDSTGLTLRGLSIFWGGAQGINFDDSAPCSNVLVEECTILGAKDAIRNKNGAGSDITYRRNWIVSYNDPRWYYRDVKGNTSMEGTALNAGGDDSTAEENIIEGWHNGIGMSPCVNPIIRRNYFNDWQDDAIELDGVVDLGTTGEVKENMGLDGFVWLSFSPRQPTQLEAIPVSFNTFQCIKAPLEDRDIPGQQVFGQGTKFNSHPAGTACEHVSLTFNTIFAYNDCFRMAPASQDTYPSNITCTDNIICGVQGPLVRNTGSATASNSFQRNCYFMQSGSEFSRNFAVDFTGGSVSYATLALAKAGPEVTAAGWEVAGIQADPRFVIPNVPGSLRPGSPAEGKGAWLRTPLSVTSRTVLETGWILLRGTGFDSTGAGLGLEDPIVVSSTTAFARSFIRPITARRPW